MALRDSWIEKREAESAAANGNKNMSQMHLARKGVITEEMTFVAKREKIDPELVRSEIARGRAVERAPPSDRNPYDDFDRIDRRELARVDDADLRHIQRTGDAGHRR